MSEVEFFDYLDVLIEGDWKDAVRKLISKKRPEGRWPKPEKKKRG